MDGGSRVRSMAVYGVSLSLSLLRCLLAGVVVFAYGGDEEGGTSKEEDEGWRDPDLLLLCPPLPRGHPLGGGARGGRGWYSCVR
jgi:hypothetical protein